MSRTLFVTGTDTGVGKTVVARALLRRAREQGLSACAFKPVASGAQRTAQGLRNEDALALMQAAGTLDEDYAHINPYCFEPAIAPHLAARSSGTRIDSAVLDRAHGELTARCELVIVEGAGGWAVPLNESETFADWVAARRWPVLLVVGMRLGCINHAVLSAEAIARRTRLAGWVANVLPPAQAALQENLDTLKALLPAPCWGVVPEGAAQLNLEVGAARELGLR